MPEETNGQNGKSRLDRIEGIIEALAARQHLIDDEFVRLDRAIKRLTDGQRNPDEPNGEG